MKKNKFHNRFSLSKVLVIFFVFLLFSVLSSSITAAKKSISTDLKTEKVVLQLKWIHQFNFAGYYAAVEKGFYKQAGLEVIIKEGQAGMDFIDEVVSGRAAYGIEMPELLIARNRGKPVVVLAAIFQHSPQVLLTRADSGIQSPHNLIGKKVMWRFDSGAELRAMLINENVPLAQIEFKELSWNINDLINGKVDAMHAYVTDQPLSLELAGIESTMLRPISYGIDFYGDCLFTSKQEIAKHPERVKSFREASLRGWAYAMENPEEIMDIIFQKYSRKSTLQYLRNEYDHMNKLIMPKLIEIGHMNPGRWKHIGDTFVKLGLLDPNYSLEGFLYDPSPQADFTKVVRIIWFLGVAVFAAFVCMIFLYIFNRKLSGKVAERTRHLSAEIAERKKAQAIIELDEERLEALLALHDKRTLSEGDLLDYALEEAVRLTASKCGYMHFIDDDEKTISLNAWSKETLKICKAEKTPHYPIEQAGIWADCVRKRKAVVHNDYPNHPDKKGYPEGHFPVLRHMSIPIFDSDKLIAIIGVGNKEDPYNESDQRQLQLFFTSTWDIIKKKRLEEEKKKINKTLQHTQKLEAIGTLAGGIAHDFNNILSAILGYTELARLEAPDGTLYAKDLEKVLKAGNRAKDLVKQILSFSRQASTERIPLHLQSLVKEAMQMLRASIPSTTTIKESIDSSCGVVLADPTQVHQILMNLCTNADHAMEKDGGILKVELQNVYLGDQENLRLLKPVEAGEYVELIVSDSGCGIAPDILEKIFDPFFTTKEPGKGTGMGLSIIHGIISEYGGAITVESELGKGTTFHLYFPKVDEQESSPGQEIDLEPSGKERILFIDDEELLLDMGKNLLKSLGYRVTVRKSSLEALTTFQNSPESFDIVITDQTMPGMTGSDLARRMLQIRPDIPIILCTGFSNIIDEQSAKKMGIREFVLKPIDFASIAKLIQKVLDGNN